MTSAGINQRNTAQISQSGSSRTGEVGAISADGVAIEYNMASGMAQRLIIEGVNSSGYLTPHAAGAAA